MIGTPCGFANYCIWHMVFWNHGPQYWLKKSRQENCKHMCVYIYNVYTSLSIYICIRRRKCWVSLNIFTLNVPVITIIMSRCWNISSISHWVVPSPITDEPGADAAQPQNWEMHLCWCRTSWCRFGNPKGKSDKCQDREHDPLVKGHNATWCIYIYVYIYTHFSSPRRYS